MMKMSRALTAVALAAMSVAAHAEDRIQLDKTTVIDNHEQPKITYIVPWQQAELPQRENPQLDILIDDALQPLDRDTLRSQIRYYYETVPKSDAGEALRQGAADK